MLAERQNSEALPLTGVAGTTEECLNLYQGSNMTTSFPVSTISTPRGLAADQGKPMCYQFYFTI